MRRPPVTAKKLTVVALGLAVVVAGFGAGRVALDHFGYCIEDVLPGDVDLATDPYIQHVTHDSAAIHWWTPDETSGAVSWGQGRAFDNSVEVEPGELHVAVLTGLASGQEYQYRVEGREVDATGTFRTAPDEDAKVTIGVVGDTGTGSDAQRDVAAILNDMDADVLLNTGDVVYRRGALCDYEEKFFDPYADLIDSTPMYAAVGNHDLLAEDGDAFDAVFGIDDRPERWFSFDYGPVHVVILDSEVYRQPNSTAIADQQAWLDTDLQATSLPWTVVALHRPLFSSTEDQADAAIRDDLGPIFSRYGVDLVLAGHAHNYERFAPIDGVTYVVTGGGGASLHGLEPGPTTVASAVAYHALEVVASPDRLSIKAVAGDGVVIDEFSLERPAA